MDVLSGWTCFPSLPGGVWTNGFISLDSSFNFKSSSPTRKPSSSLRLLMKPAIEFMFYGKTWQINSAQWSYYRRLLPWFRIWGRVTFLQQFPAALGRRVTDTVRASGSEYDWLSWSLHEGLTTERQKLIKIMYKIPFLRHRKLHCLWYSVKDV